MQQEGSRAYGFAYSGFSVNYRVEIKSKEIQEDIFGIKVYKLMQKVDGRFPFYF